MATSSRLRMPHPNPQTFTMQRENDLWQAIWEKRRDSLLQTISDKAAIFERFEESRPQIPTLRSLTKRLHSFGQHQFGYFYKGFSTGLLTASKAYPEEYVYAATLDQISYDLEVVERAADQRLDGTEMMLRRLGEADRLAFKALQQAQVYLPPFGDRSRSTTTVVTYFQKLSSIRVIPYADVALIGIPYTAIDEPFDLLAIPHEVGHYLFWHGKNPVSGEPLHREIRQTLPRGTPRWCKVWLEEAFADAFAALVAGPITAYSLMGMALRRSVSEFVTSDDDHVVPLIRPLVAFKTLKQCAEQLPLWGEWADVLMDHWQHHLTQRNRPTAFKVGRKDRISARSALHIGPTKTAGPVDILVSHVLKCLADVIPGDWNPDASLENADGLYTHFEKYFSGKDNVNWITSLPMPKPLSADNDFDWNTYVKETFQQPQKLLNAKRIAGETWEPVFLADGWTTEPGETPWPK
jgi:hypothetical protein